MFNVIELSLAFTHHGDFEIKKIIHKLISHGVVGHFERFLSNSASAVRTPRGTPMSHPLRYGMLCPQQLCSTHAPFLPHIYFLTTTAICINTLTYLPSCSIQILSVHPAVHDEATLYHHRGAIVTLSSEPAKCVDLHVSFIPCAVVGSFERFKAWQALSDFLLSIYVIP
jgi:hypothetical protein